MNYINDEALIGLVPRVLACEPCNAVCEGSSPKDNIIPFQEYNECITCEEDWETEMDLYRYWRP